MLDLSSPTIYNQPSILADYSPDGLEKRLEFFIGVPPSAPVAAFTGTPLTGTAPLDVMFTDSSTGTSITNRRWDFGDGNISNYATATNPSHRYTSAGTYSVNLTVTNAGGSNSQLRSNYISVTPAAPVAAFTGTPLSGTAPLDVTFTDSSTGTSITNRRWDLGMVISPTMQQLPTRPTGTPRPEPTGEPHGHQCRRIQLTTPVQLYLGDPGCTGCRFHRYSALRYCSA